MYFVQTRCQSEINQNLKISAHETPTLNYLLVIFSTEKYLITFFMIQAITRTTTLENINFRIL